VIAGGNGWTAQTVLDAQTFRQLETFDRKNSNGVIPGDSALLIRRGDNLFLRSDGKQESALASRSLGVFPDARFLNDDTVLTIADYKDHAAVIVRKDGTILHRVPVEEPWKTSFISSASGSRFCIEEYGYTKLNALMSPLDIDSGRPPDLQTIRVFDVASGKQLTKFQWDPRPYVVTPALSPDGHRLAAIRQGILEVYELP
jgi:hypothetical protein